MGVNRETESYFRPSDESTTSQLIIMLGSPNSACGDKGLPALETLWFLMLLPGQAIRGREVQMDRSGVIDRQGTRAM